MSSEKTMEEAGEATPRVTGELTRRLLWSPVRVLVVVSGLVLVRALFAIVVRYCLTLRRRIEVSLQDSSIRLDVKWTILGKTIRQQRTEAPISEIRAVQLENRQRYLHLLVGFGCLAVGTWLGLQWFVDGLRAGFPHLALIGAGVVAAGVLIDALLYLLVPSGPGRRRILITLGPWKIRVSGVDEDAAKRFVDGMRSTWSASG